MSWFKKVREFFTFTISVGRAQGVDQPVTPLKRHFTAREKMDYVIKAHGLDRKPAPESATKEGEK